MEANSANRAPVEARPPSATPLGSELPAPTQPAPRPPLARADSRSSFQLPPRPGGPQAPARPQFQPGGPVTAPPQFGIRPGTPTPRGQSPPGPTGSPQARPPPLRPFGPQSIAPQGPRPLQSPTSGQPPQRVPPPNNLQFGPRQPPQFGATTPDAVRLPAQPNNGSVKNGVTGPVPAQLPRQPSQGSLRGIDPINGNQNKLTNLENQNLTNNDNQNAKHSENGVEMAGIPKGRSYSIAAAPGAPNPLKAYDDRRKSVSALGGRNEEFGSKSPALGFIQEGKIESKEHVPGSQESLRSETSHEVGKDISDRPESRLSDSKMTESFIGSLPTIKKKLDDDDDVILQNTSTPVKNGTINNQNQNKVDMSDRSPSLTRSEESPEPKQVSQSPLSNKSQSVTPEPQRPKTPKTEMKPLGDSGKDIKPAVTPSKTAPKSPNLEAKPPMPVQKKPNELNTSITPADSKKSTPRKVASAPKARPKDGDNDSGVDESTQGNDVNGSPGSPNKKIPSKLPMKEKSSNSLKQSLSRSSSKSATAKTPENPLPTEKKKVPMNKVQVGSAPSPNIKAVKSKIGSLENATYKPGGGKVKIENRKIDFNNVTPKIAAKNEAYAPSGGAKKITTTKLEWNAKSKIGSLQNAAYKPGGGDKKIETVKLDFKDKAKPKVASTVNITHKPGGGAIKEHYYVTEEWNDDRPLSRCRSARAPRTPRTPRALSPRRKPQVLLDEEDNIVRRNNERNRRSSMARPASARDPPRSACSRRTSLTQRPAFSIY
ncbi:serine/arginine repetitive matrix protein 2-like isoform X3 [Ostrinia furnacalis]|uniref:serine/arginine repetitive matrix protein 2-like isoform X3 n=1 Tax=Ostrinia furnacalis TaxID=93504 RepID=UPI00103F1386|nr:serine/arginine repetitive matrix protein 2-like isoform X3 [Ostrinia furnacalis]